MAQNPLTQHYRQPKIFIPLPSAGIYNKLGSISGDVSNMPIYSMTGMDEIIVKTPDALLSGKSTVSIIESCCPVIKDAWEVTTLDSDLLLVAIRIATYGNILEVVHTCSKCHEENDYDIDLGTVVDHFAKCKYDNIIEYNDLTIKLQPLTYRQTTEFSLRNFRLQQQIAVSSSLPEEEQKDAIDALFKSLGVMQNDIYTASIETIETPTVAVTEKHFINDWLNNCDKEVFDKIRQKFDANKELWKIPDVKVKCLACGHESEIAINLDQSIFFATA